MNYTLQKIGSMLVTLWLTVTVTFLLIKVIPGNPFENEYHEISEEAIAALNKHYGLDLPIYEQYYKYITSLLHGDMGYSYIYRDRSVVSILMDGFPISFILGCEALLFSVSVGIILGSFAALMKNRWQDHMVILLTVLGISIPSFILATLLQYFLGFKLGLLPVARWGTFQHTILPVLSLSAMPIAFISRLTRTNMIEVLSRKYITAAKARGISPLIITYKHALRNALLPVIAYISQMSTKVFIGSFVVEKIFGIPGLGVWLVNAISNRDYPVIMGIAIFYGALLLIVNCLIDISFGILDPRVRIKKEVACASLS